MNAPAENDPSKTAKRRLAEACRTKDTSLRVAWAITIGEAILLAVVGLALVDYWLMLPVWMRSTGALGLAGLATLGVIRLVRFYRRPTRLKEAALDVESQRPELGCEISTAAEYLTGERKTTHEYEPELVAALEAKAAKELSGTQVHYEKKLLNPAILFVATFLGLLSLVAIAPMALTALQRTALPFSDAKYTSVDVKPGNVEIPVGRDLSITNIFSGRIPKDPKFHWQEEGHAKWQTVALTKAADGAFVYEMKNLRSDITYRVTGNDAASEEFKIETYVPPEVKDLSVRVKYPDYTKLPPVDQKSPDITAVRASQAEIRIQPSVELSKAKLRIAGLPEVALTPGENGIWTGTLSVTKDADYWIELADKKGHHGVNEKPYHIKAVPDNPPKVEITEPGKDLRASATNKVPVKISVADDFGVGEIKVVLHKLGGSEQVVTASRQSDQNGEVVAQAELELSPLGLKEYELVAYHAEAADNNTLDGPGLGKSQVYFIEITNEEAGDCKSQSQGQKVNLLVIQKQIIADTTALAANAQADKFVEMAARQRDAKDLGQMYFDSLSAANPFAPATIEMQAALKDMESARGSLEGQKRADALPPEENALAHLYQVIRQMPELENLPTMPQMADQKPPPSEKVKVVLEAIKQKKKEQPDDKNIEAALDEAKNLARSQSGINSALRNAGESEGKGQSQSASQGEGQGKSNSQSQGKSQAQGQGQGQGKGQGQGQGQGMAKGQGKGEGQGQGQGEGKAGEEQKDPADEPADPAQPPEPAQLAEKENQLSKEAAALAEKLQRLAGKDTRLGHNAGRAAARAAAKMAAAGQSMKNGGFGAAGEHGFQGEMALRTVIAQLERILKNQPEATDIANEDFPKEYEALISEYLKKLSHAE